MVSWVEKVIHDLDCLWRLIDLNFVGSKSLMPALTHWHLQGITESAAYSKWGDWQHCPGHYKYTSTCLLAEPELLRTLTLSKSQFPLSNCTFSSLWRNKLGGIKNAVFDGRCWKKNVCAHLRHLIYSILDQTRATKSWQNISQLFCLKGITTHFQ